jgi:enoyl-CoA hydratase/carnithine racemase
MISSKVRDDVLWVSFSDPASRNAFSMKAASELLTLMGSPLSYRAVVFSAPGRVFCSGGQLDDYASMPTPDEGRRVNEEIRNVLGMLSSISVPTIACVSGDAFGGGVELLSCFDYVLSVPHAMFGLWQRKIGLSFGWGGGSRLEKRIGAGVLRGLALSARVMSAREALSFGLVDQLVQPSALESSAAALAARLILLPIEPLSTLKSFDVANETTAFNTLWWNPSHSAVLASRRK